MELFKNLVNLNQLNLSKNRIQSIANITFGELNKLEFLYLSNLDRFKSLKVCHFHFQAIAKLSR